MRLVLAILLLSTAAFADDFITHLNADYQNKVFLLRGFYQGDNLQFDSSGVLKQAATTGSWTTSFLEIQSLAQENGTLKVSALRIGQWFNDKQRAFQPVRSKQKVTLLIDLQNGAAPDTAARKALAGIFYIRNGEQLASLVPDFWSAVVSSASPPPPASSPSPFHPCHPRQSS